MPQYLDRYINNYEFGTADNISQARNAYALFQMPPEFFFLAHSYTRNNSKSCWMGINSFGLNSFSQLHFCNITTSHIIDSRCDRDSSKFTINVDHHYATTRLLTIKMNKRKEIGIICKQIGIKLYKKETLLLRR